MVIAITRVIMKRMKKKYLVLNLLIPFAIIACSPKGSTDTSTSKSDSVSVSSSVSSSDNPIISSSANPSVSSSNSPSISSSNAPSSSSQVKPSSSMETIVSVTSVSLNKSSLEIYTDDTSASLVATVLPENATNKSVTWSSSDPSVATVNDGNITPVGPGTTKITVLTVDGNKTAECSLTVKQPVTIPNYVLHGLYNGQTDWTDKEMVINPYSTTEYMIQGVNLYANDVFKVHMYGETWYGYSAIKSSVKSGLVTAAPSDDNIKVLATGVYDIYCDYNESDGGHIYLAKVDGTSSTVSVSGISLSNTGKYLLVRNEFVITPTVYPNNATNKEIRWSSSDESIATVTSGGRVVAKEKKGSTTITAKTVDGNFTATCIVYVSPSQYPDYCLTGIVGGYTRSGISMRYAAIPLDTTGNYLIPDVNLIAGDELTVTNNQGARLRNKYNQIYTKPINENMSVNVYLNVNDANHDYLSFRNIAYSMPK